MNRRTFLRHILTASAASALLPTSQAAAAKRQLDLLPETDETPSPVAVGLNWHEPIKTQAQLPGHVEEGTAVWVEADDVVFVYVKGVGWVDMRLLPEPPGRAAETALIKKLAEQSVEEELAGE